MTANFSAQTRGFCAATRLLRPICWNSRGTDDGLAPQLSCPWVEDCKMHSFIFTRVIWGISRLVVPTWCKHMIQHLSKAGVSFSFYVRAGWGIFGSPWLSLLINSRTAVGTCRNHMYLRGARRVTCCVGVSSVALAMIPFASPVLILLSLVYCSPAS